MYSFMQFDGKIVAPINKAAWSESKLFRWVSFKEIIGLTVNGSGTIHGRGSSFWKVKIFGIYKREKKFWYIQKRENF